MRVGWNGAIVQKDEAVISAYDHGFLYGIGLFETFRTYGGTPYLIQRHLERLHRGCQALGITFKMTEQELGDWVAELLAANDLRDGYIRLTVSGGQEELGLPTGDYGNPTVLLMAKALPDGGAGWQSDSNAAGFDESAMRVGGSRNPQAPAAKELQLLKTRRNTPESDVRFKSLHYMNNILAKRELLGIRPNPAGTPPEGLMLSHGGWLAEGIVSNVFFVKDGIICTPSIETGILPGITRERVLELARENGFETEESFYRWEQLLGAEEVWLTNSVQELVPVTGLRDEAGELTVVGAGSAGPILLRLLRLYRQDISSSTGYETM